MKITSVKTAATTGHCMHLWVKIETDAGITGLGECVHGGHQAIALIQHELGPKLIGRDPFAIDALFEELRRARVFEGGFAGALITALTGIEIALWDLKGKALGTPVYELLGGKFRDKVRVYADCEVTPGMNFDECKKVVDEVLEARVHRAQDRSRHRRLRPLPERGGALRQGSASTTPPANGSTTAWCASPRW